LPGYSNNIRGVLTAAEQRRQKAIMMPILCAVLAADFVKQLTPKDLKLNPPPAVHIAAPAACAIPLKEIKARNPNRIDPIAFPDKGRNFDKTIAHPVPMPVCPSR
jgi:hypothetical protein